MNLIDIITDNPFQTMNIRLSDGTTAKFNLYYSYNQAGWFYDFIHDKLTVHGRRLVSSLNLLRAFKNIVPFGLTLNVSDRNEPVFITDFKEQRASLYTLSQDEVNQVEVLLEAV